MRFAVSLAALLASSSASAGGVGPLIMGGFHTEEVYYYSNATDNGNGPAYDNFRDFDQYRTVQSIANAGAGIELVLGDRDDMIQGVFRGFWMMDTPQTDPATTTTLVNPDAVVSNVRTSLSNVGVGTVGLQWGVLRAADDKFKLSLALNLGAGFVTPDHTEFLLGQAGVAVGYQLARNLEWAGELSYGLRFRKYTMHGAYFTTGIRVLFD